MKNINLAATLLLSPVLCFAQASVDEGCLAAPDATLAQPVINDAVATQFAAIKECIENDNAACAQDGLDAIDDGDLSDDELAVYWLSAGDLEYLNDDPGRARREYRRIIRQRGANRQLVMTAIERTAVQQMREQNYDDAADALDELECGEWQPSHVYTRARAHFGEGEFEEAQAMAQLAVSSQEAAGGEVPAIWATFATASMERAEQAANDPVVCTNETTAGSNIPRRVCTSQSQRDAQRRNTWNTWEDESVFGVR